MAKDVYSYGRLIVRENRFIAQVDIDGVKERVHVPNTGRLPQILAYQTVYDGTVPTVTNRAPVHLSEVKQ